MIPSSSFPVSACWSSSKELTFTLAAAEVSESVSSVGGDGLRGLGGSPEDSRVASSTGQSLGSRSEKSVCFICE